MKQFCGTTILSVRRGNKVVIGGDGQVTMTNTVMKANARKVRRLYKDKVIAGFAGGTADAFTLFERFESKLELHQGHLVRSAVELAKDPPICVQSHIYYVTGPNQNISRVQQFERHCQLMYKRLVYLT